MDSIIEQSGVTLTLKSVTESVDEKGYSTKSYNSSQVKCVYRELTGLESVWDLAGPMQPGDRLVYFPSYTVPNIGDRIVDEDFREWEIVQKWEKKFHGTLHCYEVLARTK